MEYLIGAGFVLIIVLGLRVQFLSSALRAHIDLTSKHWEVTKETLPILKELVERANAK